MGNAERGRWGEKNEIKRGKREVREKEKSGKGSRKKEKEKKTEDVERGVGVRKE
ncbi:hypothetical protein ACFPC0_27825 [Streptomyces andamanensis]|uniref:Uncharacterized protein n=1 Tax=Streptomyces andamanensis TaxID=1565035 RepID=A0ABV8TLR7_9ACTN